MILISFILREKKKKNETTYYLLYLYLYGNGFVQKLLEEDKIGKDYVLRKP